MRSPIRPLITSALVAACALSACGTPSPESDAAPSSDQAPTADSVAGAATETEEAMTEPSLYTLSTTTLDGEAVDLAEYAGRVSLVVNVASKCGYTPQYTGLQELHDELSPLGVSVLGFPSNDFGAQEPGSADQIREFCESTYGVKFPMFSKVQTKPGAEQSPIYAYLGEQTGELPGWNFCKYLVGKDGKPIAFFKSNVEPTSAELRTAIMDAL
ncbi:MAG: hypothetical protein DHS20C15_33280 [Planctomycetota bacterium]|nr:MAG: hypothetical protein DHS20C15_33280 [Planctomycetota bacterium]